jgi:hypothetical protein
LLSRREWYNNDQMRDKEKRLYFITICFFIPTCGGIFNVSFFCTTILILFDQNNLVKTPAILQEIGLYFICSQGLLNAIAMNERAIQENLVKLFARKKFFLPQTSTEIQPTTESTISQTSASSA